MASCVDCQVPQGSHTYSITVSYRKYGKGVSLESGRPRVRFPLVPGFFRVELHQCLRNWHPSGYPGIILIGSGLCLNWLAQF